MQTSNKHPPVKLYLSFDLEILLFDQIPEDVVPKETATFSRISTAALYTREETWKPPVCSKIDTRLRKIWFC